MSVRLTLAAAAIAILGFVAPATPGVAGQAMAQETSADQSKNEVKPWYSVVQSDTLQVHTGRAEQFEPIATLKKGDLVLVHDVNPFGWAAIDPPAGTTAFVFARDVQATDKPDIFKALGTIPILYPISDDPAQCWRKYRVPDGTLLQSLKEVPSDKGLFYKIVMPESVPVYVLDQFIRKASDEEIAAWKKKMASAPAAAENAVDHSAAGGSENKPQITAPPASSADNPSGVTVTSPPPPQDQSQASTPAVAAANNPSSQPETKPTAATPPDSAGNSTSRNAAASPLSESTATTTPSAAAASSESSAQPTSEPTAREPKIDIANLEQLYDKLRKEPIRTAEIAPLRAAYQSVFDNPKSTDSQKRLAEIRTQLLDARMELQSGILELERTKALAAQPLDGATQSPVLRDAKGNVYYTVKGRLTGSSVYDGKLLPLLYRVVDPQSGRTLAYMRNSDKSRLDLYAGKLVGVLGDMQKDPTLLIDVLKVNRIDDLSSGEPVSGTHE